MAIKQWIGVLILILLTSSIAILLPDRVRVDVTKTRTSYRVFENGEFKLATMEYVNLFDGSAKMRAKSRELYYSNTSGIITINREANYKENISTFETYKFDSNKPDVELVPISHEIICINCVGKILHFEYRDILYTGETKDITSPFSFGHSMKLEWQDGYDWAKVYQQKVASDKIIIRYKPTKSYEVFNVRLFDPPSYWTLLLDGVNESRYYEYETTANITANVSSTGYTYIDILDDTNRYIYSPISYSLCYQETANASHASDGSCSLNYTGYYSFYGTIGNGWDNSENVIDGDWTTYGDNDLNPGYLEINYTKPFEAVGAIWTFRNITSVSRYNYTIIPSCWDYNPSKILLKVNSTTSNGNQAVYYCMNDTNNWHIFVIYTNQRIYEEGIYWNISSSSFVYDNPGGYNYPIDILRINQFNDTNTSKNISSGSQATIDIDNRTDLYNSSVNLTGYDNPMNVSINYANVLFFPGILLENNLYQNKFIYSGVIYEKTNLSYITAGSKTIFINYSNQGNLLTRIGNFIFIITGFTFNEEDNFYFQDNFTNNTAGGYYNTDNITIFGNETGDAIDDFEDGNANGWIFIQGPHTVEESNGNKYLQMTQTMSNTGTLYGETLGNISGFDLRYAYEFSTDLWYKICRNAGSYGCESGGGAEFRAYISDSVNHVQIWQDTFYGGCGCTERYLNISGIKTSSTSMNIYTGQGFSNSVGLSSLDTSRKWVLRLYSAASGRNWKPMGGSYDIKLYSVSLSGVSLKLDTNYSVNLSSNFTSKVLTETTEFIGKVVLNATVYMPANTSIKFYMSSNNKTYESVTNGQPITLFTPGKNLSVRFKLNTSRYNVTPRVYSYFVTITSQSVNILNIDVGNDEIVDMVLNYTINSTTTPVNYTGNDSGINSYINRSCKSGSHCLIPISFVTGSGGIIQLSNFNLTENINPIRLNTSAIQMLSSIPFKLTYTGGTVQLDDVRFDFRGSKNITVYAHNSDYTESLNRTIFVKYSPFGVSFWDPIVTAWEIFPRALNQSGIEPFGQNDTHGIFKIESEAYDGNINVWGRYNDSVDTCVTQQEFRGRNYSFAPADGLVAYYKFNENSSRDYTRENNDGTVNGATWNATGNSNDGTGAFEFDGKNKNGINLSITLDIAQNWTMMAWVNTNNLLITDNSIITADGTNFLIDFNDGTNIRVRLQSTNLINYGITPSDYLNKWKHITVVMNTSKPILYVDGSFKTEGSVASSQVKTKFFIGSSTTANRDFNGTIDEVSIFNRSLSASEILTIYNNQKTQYFSNLTIQNLTINNQPIYENLGTDDIIPDIKSFTMINCSESTSKFFLEYFCFNSLCSDCVITNDAQDDCQVII